MKKCAVYVLVVTMLSQTGWAQTEPATPQEWSALLKLEPGASLSVDFKDGRNMKGRFESLSGERLSIIRNRGVTDVDRTEIARLHRTHGSLGNSAAIGGLIGAGSGAVLGYMAASDCSGGFCLLPKREATAGGAIVGAGLGAVVGLIVGAVRRKKTVIYETR
jgi:hypothetical protein